MIQQLTYLLQNMRPRQWAKNGLLFAGLIFANKADQSLLVWNTLQAFVVFCLLSGAVYVLNDLRDLEKDRQHPEKRHRPLAAGLLKPGLAATAALLLGGLAVVWAFMLTTKFGWCAVAYVAMTTAYSIKLKHVVIVDLLILAGGFVLRAYAGIAAISLPGQDPVPVTAWFLSCTLFLALFIAICKRRHELVLLQDDANHHRAVLEEYSKPFLDQMVAVTTTSTVLTYALYAISQEAKPGIIYTLPFVLYGIFRYLYLVYQRDEGGAPESTLLRDPLMIVNIVLWLSSMVYIFYFYAD
ncbi:decaprenyl-phosphate phosphoribosyltransferase [Candidatus Sumerlaeota bacterium]